MTNATSLQLRLLGPLEVIRGDVGVGVGSLKQRKLLAALVLSAGKVVSSGSLLEELWGDAPPPSASHGLEVYVSRLRRLFLEDELRFERTGRGYVVALGQVAVDAPEFERLAKHAASLAAAGSCAEAVERAVDALALWRGPVLSDVVLGPLAAAEAARLEELWLQTTELRFDLELELGQYATAARELPSLVAEHPYRERLVGQLMLALYRVGRPADALGAYESLRRRLDRDLGLQPSVELQQLSGMIVRHELPTAIGRPRAARQATPSFAEDRSDERRVPRSRLGTAAAVAGVLAVALVTIATNGGAALAPQREARVALVLPAEPAESAFELSSENNRLTWTTSGFAAAADRLGLDAETLTIDERHPGRDDVARLLRELGEGSFGLVLLPGDRASARQLARIVTRYPQTRFVFLDASLADLGLEGVENASAVRYEIEDPAFMAGVASAYLLANRLTSSRAGAISVLGGVADAETLRLVASFRRGVAAGRPGADVGVDYAGSTSDVGACERLANEQISRGTSIMLVVAGQCGRGAAAVARSRHVWIAGEDEYGIGDRDASVIASLFKDWESGARAAVEAFTSGTLPHGGELSLGLDDDYAVGMIMGSVVPENVQHDVLALCTELREAGALPA